MAMIRIISFVLELYDRLTGLGAKPLRNTVNVRVSCLGEIPMESKLRVLQLKRFHNIVAITIVFRNKHNEV